MKSIFTLVFFAGLLFLISLICLISGMVRKHKGLKWTGIITLLTSLCIAGITIFSLVEKVKKISRSRSGEEIYTALFDKPQTNCLQVIDYQDQIVPKIDYAIWLHVRTCPNELKRILSKHTYDVENISTDGMKTDGPSANQKWFKPELMGDSILVFKYSKDDRGNVQTLYTNKDSTEAYCIDILD